MATNSQAQRNTIVSPNSARDLSSDSSSETDEPNTPEEEEEEIRCEACDEDEEEALPRNGELHFCYACQFVFCDNCWRVQLPHKRKRQATSAVVHEKTNPWIARKVQNALSPPSDEKAYTKLCKEDENTAWFGKQPCVVDHVHSAHHLPQHQVSIAA
jgi:hypothetical protein